MVQYNQINLPWAIEQSNIILKIQQEQYHVVCHMSGIVYIYYQKYIMYYVFLLLCRSKVGIVYFFIHLKHHKRHSSHNLEYHCLLRLHNFNLPFLIS